MNTTEVGFALLYCDDHASTLAKLPDWLVQEMMERESDDEDDPWGLEVEK